MKKAKRKKTLNEETIELNDNPKWQAMLAKERKEMTKKNIPITDNNDWESFCEWLEPK